MKGPYERLKYDLRRLWECPVCHRRERTDGSVTSRLCACQTPRPEGKHVVMRLIEDGVQRTGPPVVLQHEPLPPLPVEIVAPAVPEGAVMSEPVIVNPPLAQPGSSLPQTVVPEESAADEPRPAATDSDQSS